SGAVSGTSSATKPGPNPNKKIAGEEGAAGGAGSGGSGFPLEPIGITLLALLAVVLIGPPVSPVVFRQPRLAYSRDAGPAPAGRAGPPRRAHRLPVGPKTQRAPAAHS